MIVSIHEKTIKLIVNKKKGKYRRKTKMVKADLVREVKNIVGETLEGVTLKDTTLFVDAVIKSIQDAVVAGEKVQLVGFGTFETVERAAREGRNPSTGDVLHIEASKSPKFKAGKAFKDAVKNA